MVHTHHIPLDVQQLAYLFKDLGNELGISIQNHPAGQPYEGKYMFQVQLGNTLGIHGFLTWQKEDCLGIVMVSNGEDGIISMGQR
jgi:hypothetical protein